MKALYILFLFLTCISQNALSQSNSLAAASAARDPQAVAIVENALAAMGGKSELLTVRTAVATGQIKEESGAVSSFTWEDDLGGKTPEFHRDFRSANGVRTLVSGHGSAAHQRGGINRSLHPEVSWALPPLHLPGVVLVRELNNPVYSVRIVADESGLMHVRTAWELNSVTAAITAQDWYFDPATNLPIKVQYLLPSTQRPDRTRVASIVFADFRLASGVLAPFNLTGYGSDRKVRTFIVQALQINIPIDPTQFELQGGQQ